MQQLIGIITALIILSLMLFLHELGHFIAGRKLGFRVEEFSIFMGPRLLSREKNGVRYSLKALPIGASVQFAGEYPDEEEDYKMKPGDFYAQPVWARFITLLAGPFMNVLTAFLIFVIIFASLGFATTKVAELEEGSLAEQADLRPGEKIVRMNGSKIKCDFDLQVALMSRAPDETYRIETTTPSGETKDYEIPAATEQAWQLGVVFNLADEHPSVESVDSEINPAASALVLGDQILEVEGEEALSSNAVTLIRKHIGPEPLKLTVLRGAEKLQLEVPTVSYERQVPLGIYLKENESPLEAIPYTFSFIGSYVRGTGKILGQVFRGRVKASESFTGPVGIVNMFSGVVTSEFNAAVKAEQIFRLFAVISLALGITNLLPIPPLDGGQIILLILEKIRGKRLSLKAQSVVTLIGVIFVLALGAMALGFDIKRLLK